MKTGPGIDQKPRLAEEGVGRSRRAALAVAIGAVAVVGGLAVTAQTSRPYPLFRVVVLGAQRIPAATVVGMSGLKVNTQVTSADIERARQRLLESGLFASVGYRFRMAGYSLVVTFDVEEPVWDAPILFDNFVWFTDEELIRAVALDLPTFTGRAPSLPRSLQRIAQALDRLIRLASVTGSISYMPSGVGDGALTAYSYRVDLPSPMPTCAVELEGVSPSMLDDARASVQVVTGQDYSRDFVARSLAANLLPLYRKRGHVRAEVVAIRARPGGSGDPTCGTGVRVSASIREGLKYAWGGATWSGGGEVSGADLDARLGLERGATLDMDRFERGLQAVRELYLRQGYVAARATYRFEYVEDSDVASAAIAIVRGPRVKMGILQVRGLPPETAEQLKAEWSHPTGAYYDALFAREFLKVARKKHAAVFRAFPNVSIHVTPADGGATVNVAISFSRD